MATSAMRPAPKRKKVTMPEMDVSVARELATHAADIAHMQQDMDRMLEEMAGMRECLNKIDKTLSEAKGGWRTFMLIGGAGAGAAAFITQLINWAPHWGK